MRSISKWCTFRCHRIFLWNLQQEGWVSSYNLCCFTIKISAFDNFPCNVVLRNLFDSLTWQVLTVNVSSAIFDLSNTKPLKHAIFHISFHRKQYRFYGENQPSWDFFHKIIPLHQAPVWDFHCSTKFKRQ